MNRNIMRLTAAICALCALFAAPGEAAAKQIYWNNSVGISRANLDGTSISSVTNAPSFRFVVSDDSNAIYYGGHEVRKLTPHNGVDSILFDLPDYPNFSDIAIDSVRSHLYFVEAESSAIYRTDLDGSNAAIVIPGDGQSTSFIRIEHVKVDPIAGKLYWTHLSSKKSFRRSNLDGTQQEQLFTVDDYIMDFELEPASGQIYWTSSKYLPNSGAVRRANYDGSGAQTLVSGLWGPYGLALDAEQGKFYFSDSWTYAGDYDSTLRVANLDGSDSRVLINFGPTRFVPAFDLSLGAVVPEPSAYALLMVAAVATFIYGRRLTMV